MFTASSRGRRIPAALHVFVIAMLALTLIGPLVTPLAVEAAQTPVPADEPIAATSDSDPQTGEQPPPPDPTGIVGEPTTAPVVEQVEEEIDDPIEETPADPATEPDDETPTLPATEPDAGEGVEEPVTEPTAEPDAGDSTDSTEVPVTEPPGELVVDPASTPTTVDIDLEPDALESAAGDELVTAATMSFSNVRTIGPSDCTPESTVFVDLTVNDVDSTFQGVRIFLLGTSVPANEKTILGVTTVESSRGSGKFLEPIAGNFTNNFKDFRVELFLLDGVGEVQQSRIVPVVTNCDLGGPPAGKPPMRFTDVLVSGPETCTAASNITVFLTVNDVDPTFAGVQVQLVGINIETNTPLAAGRPVLIDPSRGNGRFGESMQGDFSPAFRDWEIRITLLDGGGLVQQSQTFPVQPNCTPGGEPTDPPAPSMRFTNVRTIGSGNCNPGSTVFVDLTVENADPTFRGVQITLLATSTQTNNVEVIGNTIVEASRGSGKYFQPVTGNFGSDFRDFLVELRLVDGDGNDDYQVQLVPVARNCGDVPPVQPPMRFSNVGIFGPATCTAASNVQVVLTINDVDPTFQGVEIRLLATSAGTNEPVVLGDPATIEPSRNGDFVKFLPGNFTADFANWTIEILLLNSEGAVHQQQSFPVKTTCAPPAEPTAPPPPPMRFSDARTFGPDTCGLEGTVFVGLTVQNADPTFRGVALSLQATDVSSNQTTELGGVVVEASRGSGKFIQPITGDFSAGFTDFRVELTLLDNAGTTHQSQVVQVQPDCEAEQPIPPPMRFTNVFVIGPDTCTATSDVRVVLTVNDADPTFQGVEMRLLATNTETNKTVLFPGPTIKPSQGNGTFTEFIQANLTTEFSDWRVQVILFGESSIAQEQTFPVEMNCTPSSPEPPEEPTEVPTEIPTEIPTEEPTEISTEEPTEVPTEIPTEAPTESPTETPTEAPSEEPTEGPTEEPTEVPTEEPTDVPTEIPTEVPPTEIPTQLPTEEPTEAPTEAPTESPTEIPTVVPTDEPTGVPTEIPTDVPTETPTEVPTEEAPTEGPTAAPTEEPSPEQPTEAPTDEAPIEVPTELPIEIPTEEPTEAPTEIPTELPTDEPTELPTDAPTQAPTEVPSEVPTENPTEVPTEEPTAAPTENPTEVPIESPTEDPTEVPTEAPAETPTEVVTEVPTEAPVEEVPTEDPTEAPTEAPTQEIPTEAPVEDAPVNDDPNTIPPTDDFEDIVATPVAAPFQRLANEVNAPGQDDTLQIAALPVAGSGSAPGNHSTVLLATVASSLVLAFVSGTVRRGGIRRR